ncbi:hypothetical protein ACFE04_017638 [Oxalis oulophora]
MVMEDINYDDHQQEENFGFNNILIPKPAKWVEKILSFEADIIYNCLISILSPFISIFTMFTESYRRTKETKDKLKTAVKQVPAKITHGSTVTFNKLLYGLLGVLHVLLVLMLVLVVSVVLGVGLVRYVSEEPVVVKERVFFDYTDVNPKAVFPLYGDAHGGESGRGWLFGNFRRKKPLMGIPVGHTYSVSLLLLLPDSDFNREMGVFQLMAELISDNGKVVAKSSQPCMTPFRSFPVRLARTFLMGVPLLLGLSSETQRITVKILQHKESFPRTLSVRITMIPRAGTLFLPQIYESQLVVNSQLPWTKQLARNWKWTLYVWTSIHIFILLVLSIIIFCKPVLFRVRASSGPDDRDRVVSSEEEKKARVASRDREELSEMVKRLQRRRKSKRKAVFFDEGLTDQAGSSSASSMSVNKEDMSVVVGEEVGDSESVCSGG